VCVCVCVCAKTAEPIEMPFITMLTVANIKLFRAQCTHANSLVSVSLLAFHVSDCKYRAAVHIVSATVKYSLT